MLDQLVASVSQRTGLSADKAQQAVEAVITQVKAKLPAPVAAHIDELIAGNYTGTLADVEAKFKAQFSGASMADVSTKVKDGLSSVQDKIGQMFHKSP